MSEIPYTPNSGKIKTYFEKFQEAGVPNKVDINWLKSIGVYSGGNDNYIITILKFIGFVDSSGAPTDLWRLYKDPTKAGVALARGLKMGYKDLFDTYPDANRKDREAIYAFFSAKTGKAKETIDKMVATFINLSQLSNFEEEAKSPVEVQASKTAQVQVAYPENKKFASSEIHINIQLHLPATSDPTVYDNLFKSLRKNLLSEEE